MSAPVRRRIEPGVFERIDADGKRLGLEIAYKADGRARRRSVTGGLREARDALASARTRRVRYEREPANARMTLDAVLDEFEAIHVSTLRPNSRGVYRSALARIRPAFGSRRVSSIDRASLRRWIAAEAAEGLKANTIRSHYSCLRTIFAFANDDLGLALQFPRLKFSELPDPRDDRREVRILTDDELDRLLAACDEPSTLFFRVLAETGCRESEGLGLTPASIGEGTITIARQLARDGSLQPLKSAQSRRTIEVRRALSAALKLAGDRERVFPRLTHRGIERAWSNALALASLDDPQPCIHHLRHLHASRLIALDSDAIEIAARLGDRLETVQRVYAHEFDARRRSADRRASLEGLYARDGDQMATHPPSQTVTDGAKVQHLRTHRDRT